VFSQRQAALLALIDAPDAADDIDLDAVCGKD
jgi:hypothetical protein